MPSSRVTRRRSSSSRTCRRPRPEARSSRTACKRSWRVARSRWRITSPPGGRRRSKPEAEVRPLADAVIVATARTPMGRYGGQLKDVRPDDLAAVVLKEVCERAHVKPEEVEDVIMGCANQAGEDNRNVARMALLLAGFPSSVPGVTVNRLCASGMEAVASAARSIGVGEISLAVAGGVESMSRAPMVIPKAIAAFSRNAEIYDTTLGWRFVNPLMEKM